MAKALIISFAYTLAMHVLALVAALCTAHPNFRLAPHGSAIAVHREAHGYYRVEERVWFSLIGPTSAGPSHAAGHRTLAERYARQSGGMVSGIGASQFLARRALARAAERFGRDSELELDREERSYDRVTDNGREQARGAAFGYPSGPNRAEICAR